MSRQYMNIDERFDLIFNVGKAICSSYTGFSKSEILYCQQKCNWLSLQLFLMSSDPYEALIHFSLQPAIDVVSYFQLFVGCMIQFPDEQTNDRMKNLLEIIDTQTMLDDALKNARMMRALLAVSAKYVVSSPCRLFYVFYNSKKVLAHIFKKYPDYFKLNILKSNTKHKSLRFSKEDVEKFW